MARAASPLRIAVLVSGRGSNLDALIRRVHKRRRIPAEIVVVISNIPSAAALATARHAGIEAMCINEKEFPSREAHQTRIRQELTARNVGLICLAGFMRLLTPSFIRAFPHRIMNIHPALLPAFPGLHVQKKALDYGVKVAGCTVHFVDDGVDSGPIIAQTAVPIKENDTEDSLSERILNAEHKIYPQAVELFARGRLKIHGRRVKIVS